VNALRLKLGGRRRYTHNPQAFELYLHGRYAYDQGLTGMRAALHLFEEAAASDASYAPAYAGIANAVLVMQLFHELPYSEARSQAMAAVEKAFQLDPALPEGYFALAEIKTWEYAWPEAERAFRRAIELNANDAQAHADLGYLVLAPQGRFEDAVHEVRRALELDPLSPKTNESALYTLFMAGRYREAENDARKEPPLPFRGLAQSLFARALSFQSRHDEAMEAMHAAGRLGDRDWKPACVAARAGRREEALQRLHEQWSPGRPKPAPSRRFFMIYACLGDKDRALEYAEKMYAEHEPLLPTFLTYPETAWLRTDPAFATLRERVGLPR
jgi:serine/threonine-protein kinase